MRPRASIASLDLLHRLPGLLQVGLGWFLEDGAYGIVVEPDKVGPPAIICAEVQARSVVALLGRAGLELDDPDPSPEDLLSAIKQCVGSPRLLIRGTREVLCGLLSDAHPSTALERASIRGDIQVRRISTRLSLALFLSRLLGL
jgi:hypothetical protein